MFNKRFALLVLLIVIAGGAFVVGIGVTHYEMFPYPQLVEARGTLRAATSEGPGLEDGATIFRAQCAVCHGVDATGGRGPDLTRPEVTEDILKDAIYEGIPGTEMPGSWMPNANRMALVGYVLSLQDPAADAPDPAAIERGQAVFQDQNCGSCHRVDGDEALLGPSLSTVGRRRSAEHIVTSVTEPSRYVTVGFESVRVTERDGTVHEGFLINRDPFSVRLRDASGRLLAFSTAEADVELLEHSVMPSYADVLNESQLSDLVTYLSSLR